MKHPPIYQLVDNILAAWKATGKSIGVDTHLRIAEILGSLSSTTDLPRIKTLIAPILTANKQEQEEFYILFDRVVQKYPNKKPVFKKYILAAAALLLILVSFIFFEKKCNKNTENQEEGKPIWRYVDVNINDPAKDYCLSEIGSEGISIIRLADSLKAKYSHVRIDASNVSNCISYKGEAIGVDTVVFKAFTQSSTLNGKNDTKNLKGRTLNIEFTILSSTSSPISHKSLIDTISYQHTPDISSLIVKPEPPWSLQNGYLDRIKLLGFTILLLLVLISGYFWNWFQNKKIDTNADTKSTPLHRKPNSQPPYVWQINFHDKARIYLGEIFTRLVLYMRLRSETERNLFDTSRTIQATIRRAGQVTFRYRQPTSPDEYLLLIDIRSSSDHKAKLFNLIYQELLKSEVSIQRFFYDGDVRYCWNEQNRRGISIRDLQHQYSSCRLILVGTAESLISPVTGELERWVNIFDHWKNKILLSTRAVKQWGSEEEQLAKKFRLAPATLNGLEDIIESFNAAESHEFDHWLQMEDDLAVPVTLSDRLSPEAIFATLEAEYVEYSTGKQDDSLLRWLACCAIPPFLHWESTLFFGQLLDESRIPLLSIENLMRINRLSWFTTGKMPENARKALLDWFNTTYPKQFAQIRTEWKHLLEENLKALREAAASRNEQFEQSVAYEDMRMVMVVNELALDNLLANLTLEQRRQLERELRDLSHLVSEDFIALELLAQAEKKANEIATHTEEKQKQTILLPLKKTWKWQIPLCLLIFLFFWGINWKGDICPGHKVDYKGLVYCLSSPQDSLTFLEQVICDTITKEHTNISLDALKQQREKIALNLSNATATNDRLVVSFQIAQIDSLISYYQQGKAITDFFKNQCINIIRANRNLDTVSFYKNMAVAYWNAGSYYFNIERQDTACMYFEKLKAWPWGYVVLDSNRLKQISNICQFSDRTTQKNPIPIEGPSDLTTNGTDGITPGIFQNSITNRTQKAPEITEIESKIRPLDGVRLTICAFDKNTGDSVKPCVIKILKLPENEIVVLKQTKGVYKTYVLPNTRYTIISGNPNYKPDTIRFLTTSISNPLLQKIYLQKLYFNIEIEVLDKDTRQPLNGTFSSFHDLSNAGSTPPKVSQAQNSNNHFLFNLDYGHQYLISIGKDGYSTESTGIISTFGLNSNKTFRQTLYLGKGVTFKAHAINEVDKSPIYGVTYKLFELPGNKQVGFYVSPIGRDYQSVVGYEKRYIVVALKKDYRSDTIIFSTLRLPQKDFQVIERELKLRSINLDNYQPIVLYFDNDEPDKATTNRFTDKEYRQTYVNYIRKKDEYKKGYTNGLSGVALQQADAEIESFFEKEVRGGWNNLMSFSEDLYDMMAQGDSIELTLKGYTSPIGGATYNLNLSDRRVSSVYRHFDLFDGGIFKKFVISHQLIIKRESNGSTKAPRGISNDVNDKRNSIYSVRAARENRVEIIGVRVNKDKKM